jgi:tetratricopeptide (TPR) repeat protein
MRTLVTMAAAGLVLSLAGAAHASVQVIGPAAAEQCYDFAENGGDLQEGISRCSFALNFALTVKDRAATYVNRGVINLGMHRFEQALADINSGIGLDPDLGDAYIDRGATLMALNRYDEALTDLNKGIELGPHRPHIAYYDRAIINERNGDIRAAYNDYKKALELEPNFTPAANELKRFRVVHKQDGV